MEKCLICFEVGCRCDYIFTQNTFLLANVAAKRASRCGGDYFVDAWKCNESWWYDIRNVTGERICTLMPPLENAPRNIAWADAKYSIPLLGVDELSGYSTIIGERGVVDRDHMNQILNEIREQQYDVDECNSVFRREWDHSTVKIEFTL